MATAKNREDRERAERSQIITAMERAYAALNRLHKTRHQAAASDTLPEQSSEVTQARLVSQTAVMDYYHRLRPYIRQHLEDVWEEADLGLQTPGVKALDECFGAVEYQQTRTHVRNQGEQLTQSVSPTLLSYRQLQRAFYELDAARVDLGFGADVDTTLPTWGFEEVQRDDAED